jgi:hypothetical protein
MIVLAIFLSTLFSSVVAVLLAHTLQQRQAGERKVDMERQDKVADQVLSASELTNTKLETIHILVNSNMTAAMQAEKDAIVRELAMMKEVIELNRSAGREPSKEAIEAIEYTQAKIDELSAQLEDRLRQTNIAELQEGKS